MKQLSARADAQELRGLKTSEAEIVGQRGREKAKLRRSYCREFAMNRYL